MNACNLFNAFDASTNEGLFYLTTHYIKQTQLTNNKLYLIIIKDFPLYFAIPVRGQDLWKQSQCDLFVAYKCSI